MFSSTKRKNKTAIPAPQANEIFNDWDRENSLEILEQLSDVKDVHTLGELFTLHRIMHEYKERKGIKEERADTRLRRQSVH